MKLYELYKISSDGSNMYFKLYFVKPFVTIYIVNSCGSTIRGTLCFCFMLVSNSHIFSHIIMIAFIFYGI